MYFTAGNTSASCSNLLDTTRVLSRVLIMTICDIVQVIYKTEKLGRNVTYSDVLWKQTAPDLQHTTMGTVLQGFWSPLETANDQGDKLWGNNATSFP